MEIWKSIKDYENYQVSNLGRVKSLNYGRTGKEQILKPAKDKDGYLYVGLCKNGKTKLFKIHRLVAQAFIPNIENKPCINHIDCDRQNNCVDNIEWCTIQENNIYAYKIGLKKPAYKSVIAINITTGEQTYFNSQKEAAEKLNLHPQHINSVLKGRLKRTGNYTFKYKNEDKQENTLF